MAKAKSSESKPQSSPAKKPAGAKSKAAKAPSGSGNTLGIDTNLVAQAAAMAVGNKALMHERQTEAEPQSDKKETSTFKSLKNSLAKPGGATLNSFLQSSTSPAAKKSNLPFGGGKQTGRNQTFGADVTRSGVPRRTPG